MNRFKGLTIDKIQDDMCLVNKASIHWWAYCYWREELRDSMEKLESSVTEDDIGFYRYHVLDARQVLIKLYNRMVVMPEFSEGWLPREDWMDEFEVVEKE